MDQNGSNERNSSLMASIRFKFEAIGFGLSELKEEKKEADAANDVTSPRDSDLPMTPIMSKHAPKLQKRPSAAYRSAPRLRTRTETLKIPGRRNSVSAESVVESVGHRRRRCFSDPGFLASLDTSITWAKENETNTDFLKSMAFSMEEVPQVLLDGSSKDNDCLWTEDHSVAYILNVEKDGTTQFSIRKGSLKAIIEQIVVWLVRPPGSSKASIQGVESQLRFFLCAHERVVSTQDLLGLLSDLVLKPDSFNSTGGEETAREGVFKFASFWLKHNYYPDFVGFNGVVNSETMAALHQFITSTFVLSNEASKAYRNELLNMIRDTGPWLTFNTVPTAKKKKFTRKLPGNMLDLSVLDLTEEECAEALTRVDATMMRTMKRSEVLSKHFETMKRDNPTAAYILYAERLKKFGFWIATQIICAAKMKTRVRMFRKWVLVAKNCVLLNNFSSTCAILAGLSHQAVTRMTSLMREIPADVINLKKEMEENFMGFSDNYVRGLIQHCINNKMPCIPTIDVLRKDMMRIDEGSKGDDNDGLLKFFKIVSFGKAILFIEQAYSQPFPFEGDNLSDRENLIDNFVSAMPNAVKSTVLLMKISFEVQKPTTKELKTSLYKQLVKNK